MEETAIDARLIERARREFEALADGLGAAPSDSWDEALRAFLHHCKANEVIQLALGPLWELDMDAASWYERANPLDPSLRAHPEVTQLPADGTRRAALILQLFQLFVTHDVRAPMVVLKLVGVEGTRDARLRQIYTRFVVPLVREVGYRIDALRDESRKGVQEPAMAIADFLAAVHRNPTLWRSIDLRAAAGRLGDQWYNMLAIARLDARDPTQCLAYDTCPVWNRSSCSRSAAVSIDCPSCSTTLSSAFSTLMVYGSIWRPHRVGLQQGALRARRPRHLTARHPSRPRWRQPPMRTHT